MDVECNRAQRSHIIYLQYNLDINFGHTGNMKDNGSPINNALALR